MSAPRRSSGTARAAESSNDGGRMFPDGETSTTSPLLPTPNARDGSRPTATPEWWETRNTRLKEANPNLGELHKPLETVVMEVIELSTSSSAGSLVSPSAQPDDARPVTTTAGSGPSSPVLLGSYDPARSSSRTSEVSYRLVMWTLQQASLFGDLPSERFSETWPISGMTRRGRAFALPTSARVTDESASSSSLPTPTADQPGGTAEQHLARKQRMPDGANRMSVTDLRMKIETLLRTPHGMPKPEDPRHPGSSGNELGRQINRQIEDSLLPTPNSANVANDGTNLSGDGREKPNKPGWAVSDLLPTPKTTDGNGAKPHGDGGPGLREIIELSLGEPTNPPSDEPSEPSDEQHPGPSTRGDG